MDVKGTVFGVVGIVVGLIIISSLAIPTIIEVSGTQEVRVNDYTGPTFELDDAFVIEFDATTSALTVDGSAVTIAADMPLVVTDAGMLNCNSTPAGVLAYYPDGEYQLVTMQGNWSATLADGVLTVTDTAGTYTQECTTAMRISADGDYLLNARNSGSEYLANVNSPIYVYNVTSTLYVYGSGTISEATVHYRNLIVDLDLVTEANSNDSTTVGAASFDANGDVAVSYFIPIEYKVTVQDSGTSGVLFSIIPMLLIISLVMMAVRLVGGRN